MTSLTATAEARTAAGGTHSVAASFAHCHAVTRAQAKNFYYGLRLTPEPKRSALYAVYAFMRACDDLVDAPVDEPIADAGQAEVPSVSGSLQTETSVRRERVELFRADLDRMLEGRGVPEGPMWPAFAHVVETYPVKAEHLHAMLDGQLADLEPTAYRRFDDLYDYCYRVASVVGLVCVSIWGHDGAEEIETLAEHRGIAMQLTNVLRDVTEDAQRGRVYLPGDDLARFDLTPESLAAAARGEAAVPESFTDLMRFEIDRARGYYDRSAPLESHLDPACRATCWAMMRIYRRLLDKIAARPVRVMRQRVSLSPPRKAYLAARATWKRTWRS